MHVGPRFLFVPVSGPGGAGEYYRSLAIAAALQRHWPSSTIRFVLNREAPYAADAPYPSILLDDSPTRATAAVNDFIRAEQPDVVFFDSSGRISQYRAAQAVGARVVYLSSRPKTRWKGFRWRRMRLLDQHWIAQPAFLGGTLTPWQRLKLRMVQRPRVLFLDTLHEPMEQASLTALQRRLGLVPQHYVVLCPGGGGIFGSGTDAARVFYRAAHELAAVRPEPVVAVLGPRLSEQLSEIPLPANLHVIPSLPNGQLLGLIRDATVAAVNGGSLLLQSLVQAVPLVAVPIAGDQLARIRCCARYGYVWPASLDVNQIVDGLRRLLVDEMERSAMRGRVEHLALRNGVEVALEATAGLLAGRQLRLHMHTEMP